MARAQELAGEGEIGVGAGEVGGRRTRWAHRPRGDRHRAGRLRPREAAFRDAGDGHLMLEDPEVVIQGDGVLHVRHPVPRGR